MAEARFSISLEITFELSRIEMGVFLWRDFAIDLCSLIFAKTGILEILSISCKLYSCLGLLILFTIIPFIGVFCSLAKEAAFSVV